MIFRDDVLASNFAGRQRQLRLLEANARFEQLADWVLPSPRHERFRFAAEFSQTNPAPASGSGREIISRSRVPQNAGTRVKTRVLANAATSRAGGDLQAAALMPDDPYDRERLRVAEQLGLRRVQTGGRLVSAVFDLIESAREAGQLDRLRDRLIALESDDEIQQRCRIALLALAEIARSDFKAALPLLDQMEARLRAATFPELADRWPETLLLSVAVEHPPLHDIAETMLVRILADQVRAGRHSGSLVWDNQMQALLGRLRYLRAVGDPVATGESPPPFGMPPRLAQWSPVSEGDEATFAQGFPNSHWHRFEDRVEKLVGHRDEYLYYCSPLRGDFDVECDISGFGHREGQLAVGGNWLWLHFAHRQFETGNLRGSTGLSTIEPRLSEVNDWVHYRSVVRDGVCRSYINGRLLLSEQHRQTQFPWLAVRSPYWASTSVRDLRITGSPTIPEQISLSNDPELSGWVRYHLDSVGGETDDWRFDESLGPEGGIVARRKDEYAGTFQESLLRFHRPLLEDGVLEYEFDYQPGHCDVAPALGRQAFLIGPDGVRRHWITDGVWDRSGLDPLNRSDPLSAIRCPLQIGWNKLRFAVTDDELTIAVNGQAVLQTEIEAANDRMFGLFHFADQSRVRVRNLHWSGEWPKTLPPLHDQELRDQAIDTIDARLAQLSDWIEIDFVAQQSRSKLNNGLFAGIEIPYGSTFAIWKSSDGGGTSTQQRDGILMTRAASQNFNDTQVAVRYRVTGDFDIVAEFSGLKVETPYNGNSAIYLIVVADDPLQTHSRVWHGEYAHPGIDRRRVSQVEFNRYRNSGVEIGYSGLAAEACNSGRLRISRIGKRQHFMIAEENSPNYRLIHSEDVVDEPLKLDGVRLAAGTYDNRNPPSGGVRVNWKKLTIRARRLSPFASPATPLKSSAEQDADEPVRKQLLLNVSGN